MNHYCIYLSDAYLTRGIALYKSLRSNEKLPFKLWIMCLESKGYEYLSGIRFESTSIISISDLELFDPELHECKKDRTKYEYYASLKAAFLLYILKNNKKIEYVTYLDADLYAFNDLGNYLNTIKDYSILITPHRFKSKDKKLTERGSFNAGFISIKNDSNGINCLEWWRAQVIVWCYNRVEDGKYADQKYLDSFPVKFSNVFIADHVGINAGPWNIKSQNVEVKNSRVYINGVPLIVYHFHGVYKISNVIFDVGTSNYATWATLKVRKNIYMPYLVELKKMENKIINLVDLNPDDRRVKGKINSFWWYRNLYGVLKVIKRIAYNSYILIKIPNQSER